MLLVQILFTYFFAQYFYKTFNSLKSIFVQNLIFKVFADDRHSRKFCSIVTKEFDFPHELALKTQILDIWLFMFITIVATKEVWHWSLEK